MGTKIRVVSDILGSMRKTQDELKTIYEEASKLISFGNYSHYKNPTKPEYKLVTVALEEGSWEPLVVYENVESGVRTVRTIKNFTEEVEVDGKMVKRFTLVEES